jgi:hypothetical protein
MDARGVGERKKGLKGRTRQRRGYEKRKRHILGWSPGLTVNRSTLIGQVSPPKTTALTSRFRKQHTRSLIHQSAVKPWPWIWGVKYQPFLFIYKKKPVWRSPTEITDPVALITLIDSSFSEDCEKSIITSLMSCNMTTAFIKHFSVHSLHIFPCQDFEIGVHGSKSNILSLLILHSPSKLQTRKLVQHNESSQY